MSAHKTNPDTDSIKEVFFIVIPVNVLIYQRHVQILWHNGLKDNDPDHPVVQLLELRGGPENHAHLSPLVKAYSRSELDRLIYISLGRFTPAQRDEMVKLAKELEFKPRSRMNNCQVWLADLLQRMAEAGLISQTLCDEIVRDTLLLEKTVNESE